MFKKISIYDFDGTLVDSSHRYRTIQTPNGERIDFPFWVANTDKTMGDSLLPLADQYREELESGEVFTIIATARWLCPLTYQFINERLAMPHLLIGRDRQDNQISGKDLKIRGLTKVLNLKQFKRLPAIFYEDNTDYLKAVCDTFRIRGVYVPSNQGH